LILPIGRWVLQTACAQAASWLREKKMHLRVAVNIAAKQIHHDGFVEQVRKTLDDTGLPPEMLELEITESSIVENLEETVSKLRRIKELGVTVAIDDFGTGYSSLSYLKQLPIDRLKIDRSFVKDTPTDADDCAIVRTIIAMSNNLGLAVIAEGVESQEQVDFLTREGCHEIQGYWLSKPLPVDELEKKFD
jgi:EAL domain-containing protein (putative c-di-GMP-specific phosphodiesterase class I)